MKPKSFLHHQRWTLRLFEWGILSCVLLILTGVFLHKVRYLQIKAERLSVQATVDNLRAAVLLYSAMAENKETAPLAARPGGNPVELLKLTTGLKPSDYLGERSGVTFDEIVPGKWYYDRGQGALVYYLRNAVEFESPLSGPARIRLCLREVGTSKLGCAQLQLEACEPYRWKFAN